MSNRKLADAEIVARLKGMDGAYDPVTQKWRVPAKRRAALARLLRDAGYAKSRTTHYERRGNE